MDGYLTPEEAAARLKISRGRVSQLIRAGLLDAEKFGSTWAISAESVERRRRDNPGPGNPNFAKR